LQDYITRQREAGWQHKQRANALLDQHTIALQASADLHEEANRAQAYKDKLSLIFAE
jgi:hypothetical protein